MKKFKIFLISITIILNSCTKEVTISDADIQRIVNAAVAAALATYPSSDQIAQAAADAARCYLQRQSLLDLVMLKLLKLQYLGTCCSTNNR